MKQEVNGVFYQLLVDLCKFYVTGRYPQSGLELPTMAELVKAWDFEELADEARLPVERIEAIAKGERPTDDDLIALGRVLDLDTAQLLEIRTRDFKGAGNGQGRKNG